jgi:ubiquinone/menaquinone biosynthesis C-methylase UbiE
MTFCSVIPLVCPITHDPLFQDGNVLCTEDGAHCYAIVNGIPNCVVPLQLGEDDKRWSSFYDWFAPFYAWSERVLGRAITGLDIVAERKRLADLIPASLTQTVLDVSPGPGIYQAALAQKVGSRGQIVALDLSAGMLNQCKKVTADQVPEPVLVQANAAYLPFPNKSFDGLFHFGGINLFSEPERALSEFARVVKPGGWVVFGDEHFSESWRGRHDWRARLLPKLNPGYNRTPPETPASLSCLAEHEVIGGLGYLRVCRVENSGAGVPCATSHG